MRILALCISTALLLSCPDQVEHEDNRPLCERAVDHIDICTGLRPFIQGCDDEMGAYILSLSCDEIPNLWR